MKIKRGSLAINGIDNWPLNDIGDILKCGQLSRIQFKNDNDSLNSKMERMLATHFSMKYGLCTNSCTTALDLILNFLSKNRTMDVIIPSFCFSACVSSIVRSNNNPVLCDIDNRLNLCIESCKRNINEDTVAILIPHMLGRVVDDEPYRRIADDYSIALISDVSQSFGALSKENCTPCQHSHFVCGSLNAYKSITAGEGGFLVTDILEAYTQARKSINHGFEDSEKTCGYLGFNGRLSEISALLGIHSMKHLKKLTSAAQLTRRKLIERLAPELQRKINHSDNFPGEVGNTLIFTFENSNISKHFSNAIGSRTLDNTGRHHIWKTIGTQAFFGPNHTKTPTQNILERTVAIGIGFFDPYSGVDVSASLNADDSELEKVANALNEGLFKI